MPPAAIEREAVELSRSKSGDDERRRFPNLRSVQWRIDLGILPSSSSSVDDLRRVTADSRRRLLFWLSLILLF
uniref:Uncharacterized protein MANES_14G157900 n=1 Tax=Rhizophora mucronata TaxID=61149 RepID=A0A2P2KIH6_RHIMU